MRIFTKTISMILIICFGLTNISFASEINSFKLAAPSHFSSLEDMEFKEAAQVQIGVCAALKKVGEDLNIASLKRLGVKQFSEKTIFGSKLACTLSFNEVEKCVISGQRIVTEKNGNYIIKARVNDNIYYCLISQREEGGKYNVSVVPERIIKEALEKGVIKFTHSSISERDRAIIELYTAHEISTENNTAIDERISESMLRGNYAVDDVTERENPLYRHTEKNIYQKQNYSNLLKALSRYLTAIGVSQGGIKSIVGVTGSIPLILIPYVNESELPDIVINGQPIKVRGHSSPFATYIFVPQTLYQNIGGTKIWKDNVVEYINRIFVHEIGARCGLRATVKNGSLWNLLDEYFLAYTNAKKPATFTIPEVAVNELSNLSPVNLLKLELRKDYAAGKAINRRSLFNRVLTLLLAGLPLTSTTGCAKNSDPASLQSSRPSAQSQERATIAPDQAGEKHDYEFARDYSVSEIVQNPEQARDFIIKYLTREAEYYKIARVKGIAVDGWNIDSQTLEPVSIREHTAASKECFDLAVQIKILIGNEYAIRLTGFGNNANLARQEALKILREKMNSYEQFNRDFPVFGGFLPWIKVKDRVEPNSDWSDRIPALDNGEWVWSLYATYHTLQKIGETDLAMRYKNYFYILVQNAPVIFYDQKLRKIRAEVKIGNPEARSVGSDNYSNNVPGYYLDDPYEGLMMVYFLTLFTNLPQSEKDHIWGGIKMERITTSWGTTYKGWPPQSPLDGSPHTKLAFMFLPMTDNPIALKVYLLQEKIRTNMHKYGIPVSTNTPGAIGYTSYAPNVFGVYGPFSMIFGQTLQGGDVTRGNYGLGWFLNGLSADKMQGPLGSGESFSVKPGTNQLDRIAPVLTADGKMILWLAISGGIINEIRESLKEDGLYGRFIQRVDQLYADTFGSLSLVRDNAQFRTPQGPIVGSYMPTVHEQTTESIDLSIFWQYPLLDKWGDKTAARLEGDKMVIEYKPGSTGGWGWAGGSLKGPLTPTKNSAIYFKGRGSFQLKLESEDKSAVYIDVTLEGENTWTKVPLSSAEGKTFFVIVIDHIMSDITITDRIYSPNGNIAAVSAPHNMPTSEPRRPKTNQASRPELPPTTSASVVDLLSRYNLSSTSNWGHAIVSKSRGKLIVKHNESADGYGWSWAGENLREPYTLKTGEGIRVRGTGVFTLKLEGSEVVNREVNLKAGGSVIINDLPPNLKILRMVIDKVMYGTSVTIEGIEVVSTTREGVQNISAGQLLADIERGLEVEKTLWDFGTGRAPSWDMAMAELGRLAPNVGRTPQETQKIYQGLLYDAMAVCISTQARADMANKRPNDDTIRALASRIKDLEIEIIMPSSQLPDGKAIEFRKTLETVFGDRLRVYQRIEDIGAMIKPETAGKTIVMTIELTDSEINSLNKIKGVLDEVRFMNFEKMDVKTMPDSEFENYMAETLSILLSARAITPAEAKDENSDAYKILAHLLEKRMPDIKEMSAYINTIADSSIDIIKKLRYLLKAILKALPIEAYKVIRPAVQVLWSA